jgi:hypothetical protein
MEVEAPGLAMCLACSKLIESPSPPEELNGPWTCTVFPQGIPDEIMAGYDHRQPLRNEIGVFELASGQEDVLRQWEELRAIIVDMPEPKVRPRSTRSVKQSGN